MLILALDIATVTGWALGRPGDAPRYGTLRLKKKDEDAEVASFNVGCFLADVFSYGRPDLVVYEEPFPPIVHCQMAANSGRIMQNNESMELPLGIKHVIWFCCRRAGVRVERAQRNTVLKHFTGKAKWGGRPEAKKAVVDRCHMLGLMPKSVRNDDIADAIAIHSWAGCKFDNAVERELVLFDQGKMKCQSESTS